jgi:hypothetical protein
MNVCLAEDDYTRSRFFTHPRWKATLSDGSAVIADDDRPELAEPSAWLRLGEYLRANGLGVVDLEISFRSHVEKPVPAGAAGYFFRTGLVGWFGGASEGFFLVGHLNEQGMVVAQRWSTPALLHQETEERDPADAEKVGPSLLPGVGY